MLVIKLNVIRFLRKEGDRVIYLFTRNRISCSSDKQVIQSIYSSSHHLRFFVSQWYRRYQKHRYHALKWKQSWLNPQQVYILTFLKMAHWTRHLVEALYSNINNRLHTRTKTKITARKTRAENFHEFPDTLLKVVGQKIFQLSTHVIEAEDNTDISPWLDVRD